MTLPPTETSDESEDDVAPNEQNILTETLIINSIEENSDVNIKRAETQKLLDEIVELIKKLSEAMLVDIKLDETMRGLKACD